MGGSFSSTKEDRDLAYQLDGRPPLGVALPLGLQHVLTMFVGNLAPVLILSGITNASGMTYISPEQKLIMVQCAMLISGLATLLQLYPVKIGPYQIGGGLPIVMGTSFVFVSAMVAIMAEYGINGVFGATLVGSFVQILFGLFVKQIKSLFPPVVIGCVLMSIGLNLLPVGINYFGGGASSDSFGSWQNILIGTTVVVVILAVQRLAKGMLSASAILIGIIVGYVISAVLGQVDFSVIADARPVSAPIPFLIAPAFYPKAIVSVALLYIISSLETMGNVNGITVAVFNREATQRETSGAIMADGVGCFFASIFSALPNTAFGQNAGVVAMTRVVNKWCVATGAFVLILAGFFPPVGAVFSIMPQSVLGGAVITVFGMILVNGIKLIVLDGLNERNVLIIAITFGVGYAMSKAPDLVAMFPDPIAHIFGDTTIAVCSVAIVANLLFRDKPGVPKPEKTASATQAP
jgi:NCS2 family nucleobase:cation symporter-2